MQECYFETVVIEGEEFLDSILLIPGEGDMSLQKIDGLLIFSGLYEEGIRIFIQKVNDCKIVYKEDEIIERPLKTTHLELIFKLPETFRAEDKQKGIESLLKLVEVLYVDEASEDWWFNGEKGLPFNKRQFSSGAILSNIA